MRLIDARKLVVEDKFELVTFFEDAKPYAILSHTWDQQEVTFQDAQTPPPRHMKGFDKIFETCRLALEFDLGYAWVDTCCIDKTSSAELTESINSMFRWYENAKVCFAFLADLPAGPAGAKPWKSELQTCRWFTRGWTLQELLAPANVYFYDAEWTYRGSKVDMQAELSEITGVDVSALRGERRLKEFPLAHRMGWASHRDTTRTEDAAYCLLGIFDVNMPLIYGEGRKAFVRLQEEIIKRTNDLTIFAWSPRPGARTRYCSVLAPSPAEFAQSGGVEPFEDKIGFEPGFSINNKGLLISSALWTLPVQYEDVDDDVVLTFLELGTCPAKGYHSAGIFLRKVGPGSFFRDGRLALRTLAQHPAGATRIRTTEFYISVDIPPRQARLDLTTLSRINFAVQSGGGSSAVSSIVAWMPEEPWDNAHRLFFVSQRNFIQALRVKIRLPSAAPGDAVDDAAVVVISDVNATLQQPRFKLFAEAAGEREAALARYLFRPKSFRARIKMEDLKWKFPEVVPMSEAAEVVRRADGRVFVVRAVKKLGIVKRVSMSKEIWCLDVEVAERPAGAVELRKEKEPTRGLERRRKATDDSNAPPRRGSDLRFMAGT